MIIHTKTKVRKELDWVDENPPALLRKKDGSLYKVIGHGAKRKYIRIK